MKTENQEPSEYGTNGLTGLLRMELFTRKLFGDIERCIEEGMTEYSFVLVDIDDFKSINDIDGANQGGYVLWGVGEVIISLYEEGAACGLNCRKGGEEFLLAFSGINEKDAAEIAELLRKEIMNYPYCDAKTGRLDYRRKATASIGVTSSKVSGLKAAGAEERKKALEKIVGMADTAMKYAKFRGKDRVEVYSAEVQEEADKINAVRNFYFQNVFNPCKTSEAVSHPFMQENPDIRERLLAHCKMAAAELNPRDTRILARLADNLYRMVYEIPQKKEGLLKFIRGSAQNDMFQQFL